MKIAPLLSAPALFILISCSPENDNSCINPRVIDGDTIKCDNMDNSIRIIPSINDPSFWFDAPEKSDRNADCPSEKKLGIDAKNYLEKMIKNSEKVSIQKGIEDKDYFGRYLRVVAIKSQNKESINVAHALREKGLGAIYHKSEHPVSWCKGVSNGIE